MSRNSQNSTESLRELLCTVPKRLWLVARQRFRWTWWC
jgi:hypothetical protein